MALRPGGAGRRPVPPALRAARVAVRQPALREPAVQPRAPADPAPREPLQPHSRRAGRRGLPLRGHDLPAHRAPHRGRDVALAALPGRAAARDVLRGLAGARARARPRARRVDDGRHPARGHRGPGDGHRPDDPADDRIASAAPGRPALPLGVAGNREGRLDERSPGARARPQRPHRRVQGADLRRARRAPPTRPGAARAARGLPPPRRRGGRLRAAREGGAPVTTERVGFFTDTSVCIGCKACEVACKEWNDVPAEGLDFTGHSYDNTGSLGADTWRHVAFVEQARDGALRWLMSSDVCKHCTSAACLEVCPTGSLFRTEFGTVVVQQDICNGCGYCIPACPYGVIDRREEDGRAHKCTLCYDRLKDDMTPACAQACPTESIQFGPLEEMRERAFERLEVLHVAGESSARLYGEDPGDGVGGQGSIFLLLDEPEVYGLPPDPVSSTRDLGSMWRAAAGAGAALLAGIAVASFGGGGD